MATPLGSEIALYMYICMYGMHFMQIACTYIGTYVRIRILNISGGLSTFCACVNTFTTPGTFVAGYGNCNLSATPADQSLALLHPSAVGITKATEEKDRADSDSCSDSDCDFHFHFHSDSDSDSDFYFHFGAD